MMTEEYEKEYFESYIERYKTSRYDIKRENIVLSLLAPTNGDTILDVGCGVGQYSRDICETGAKAISADFSSHALRLGRKQYGLQYLIQANASKLPFKDGSFDKVIAIELIEHVENQNELFSELNRVLKHDGCLLLTTSPITSSFFFPFIQKIRQNRLVHVIIKPYDISGAKHVCLQHPRIMKNRLGTYGFEVIKEKYWNALHLGFFLSRTNIKFLHKMWKVSNILDNYLGSPRLCNDVIILAKKTYQPITP